MKSAEKLRSFLSHSLVIATIFMIVGVRAASAAFILVRYGKPASTIVVAAKASENARAGATELQRYVRKISGAELPIVGDEQSPGGPLILIGSNRFTEKMTGLKIPSGITPQLREE